MDENDLARLLDKRMSRSERESAVAHLSESDPDAELLADAAYMLRELEAEDGVVIDDADEASHGDGDDEDTGEDATVVPLRPPSTARARPRRIPARWLALAAVLAGVVLVPLALSRYGSRGPAGPGDLAALLAGSEAGLPAGWTTDRPWGVTRGRGDPATEVDNGRSALLGVLWVDLEVAVAAGQAREAGTLCGQIEHLLSEVPAGGAIGLDCARIVEEARRPAAGDADFLRRTGALLEDHFGYDADFALGAWAEAARLAAARRDGAFFSAKQARRALDRFAESGDLTPAARQAARQVRARLQGGGTPDWNALKPELDNLLVVARQPDFE